MLAKALEWNGNVANVREGLVVDITKHNETFHVDLVSETACIHVGKRRSLKDAKLHAQTAVDVLRLMG